MSVNTHVDSRYVVEKLHGWIDDHTQEMVEALQGVLKIASLKDEPAPNAATCMHQRATLVKLSQLDRRESELFGQIRHGSDRVLVVARQKDDPMAAFDDRIGSQGGCFQVIETFHEPGSGERLRDEGGGQESVQLLRWN